MGLAVNILEEGLIYGIMTMGVYITYRILDFPDLSVDGTFPLGCCVTGALILAGVPPWLTCVIVFFVGMAAGCVTGLLHVKLGITDLLSGIIVMTGLLSINLVVTGNKSILAFYNETTIFSGPLAKSLPPGLYRYRVLIIVFLTALAVKLLIDFFFKTKTGLLLRATGDNNQFVTTALARDPGKMKILGLALGNGCTALAGGVLAQQAGSASTATGAGMVVQALASVIIGTNVFRRVRFMQPTTMVLLGSIAYKACLTIAIRLNLPTQYLKLLMAVLFVVVLVTNRYSSREGRPRFAKDN
ncbi:MAG: ABC transporter permease [Clostridiales bacterium]|nr:ABC transporter permease [Clostridiales bacterium]